MTCSSNCLSFGYLQVKGSREAADMGAYVLTMVAARAPKKHTLLALRQNVAGQAPPAVAQPVYQLSRATTTAPVADQTRARAELAGMEQSAHNSASPRVVETVGSRPVRKAGVRLVTMVILLMVTVVVQPVSWKSSILNG